MLSVRSRYTRADFARLVTREHDELELKSGIRGKALQEALVALSNTNGGVILLGVQEDRALRSVPLTQGVQDAVTDAAHDAHEVGQVELREVDVAGTPIVAVTVHPRHDGFAQTSDGRVLVRRGARNRALLGEELARWLAERSTRRYETTATGLRLDACEPSALDEVCGAYDWDPGDPALADHLRDRLLLAPDGSLTVAGALLLTDPTVTLGSPRFAVDVRGFETVDGATYVRRDVIAGPVQRQVREATSLILRDLGNDMVVLRIRRHDLHRLPARAVREAIANAIAHRHYDGLTQPVVVEVRPHAVVVHSPGGLPPGVDVRRLRTSQKARNPALISVLRRLEIAEDSGLGIDLIEDQMRSMFLRDPTFEDAEGTFTLTLPRDPLLSAAERAWVDELEAEGVVDAPSRALLVAAARGEVLTNAQARVITGIDSTEARRALARLRDRGLLKQHGTRGGASYTLGDLHPPPSAQTPPDPVDVVLSAAADGPVTNRQVRALTGLDRPVVTALLQRLCRDGRLVQRGERRTTTYVLHAQRRPR